MSLPPVSFNGQTIRAEVTFGEDNGQAVNKNSYIQFFGDGQESNHLTDIHLDIYIDETVQRYGIRPTPNPDTGYVTWGYTLSPGDGNPWWFIGSGVDVYDRGGADDRFLDDSNTVQISILEDKEGSGQFRAQIDIIHPVNDGKTDPFLLITAKPIPAL